MPGFDNANPTTILVTEPLIELKQGNSHNCTVYMINGMKCVQAAAYQSGADFYCLRHARYVQVTDSVIEEKVAEETTKIEEQV